MRPGSQSMGQGLLKPLPHLYQRFQNTAVPWLDSITSHIQGVLWYSSHKPLRLISRLEHSTLYQGPIFQIEIRGSCWFSKVHLYYLCFNISSCSLTTTRAYAYGSGWITPVPSFPLTQSRNSRHKSYRLIWNLSFKWNKNTTWIMT